VERHNHNPPKPASKSLNTDSHKQAVPAAKPISPSKVLQKLSEKANDNGSAASGWDFDDF
jgi:hypothetical protein